MLASLGASLPLLDATTLAAMRAAGPLADTVGRIPDMSAPALGPLMDAMRAASNLADSTSTLDLLAPVAAGLAASAMRSLQETAKALPPVMAPALFSAYTSVVRASLAGSLEPVRKVGAEAARPALPVVASREER